MAFFFIFFGMFFLPAVMVLLAPRRWLRAVTSWVLLGVGLLLIEDYVSTASPYDDDGGFFGPGMFVGLLSFAGLAAIGAFAFRWSSDKDERQEGNDNALLQWAGDWAVPFSLLLVAGGMHWLRNRLAGMEPAATLHLTLLLAGTAVCALAIWRKKFRLKNWTTLDRFVLVIPASVAMLVAWDSYAGFRLWSQAEQLAAGRPRCMMSYGGFEYRREAVSGWDLSPLVNRLYGIWAPPKAPVVFVEDANRIQRFRRINGHWQEVSNDSRNLPCTPHRP